MLGEDLVPNHRSASLLLLTLAPEDEVRRVLTEHFGTLGFSLLPSFLDREMRFRGDGRRLDVTFRANLPTRVELDLDGAEGPDVAVTEYILRAKTAKDRARALAAWTKAIERAGFHPRPGSPDHRERPSTQELLLIRPADAPTGDVFVSHQRRWRRDLPAESPPPIARPGWNCLGQ